jgi:hypothetical protein
LKYEFWMWRGISCEEISVLETQSGNLVKMTLRFTSQSADDAASEIFWMQDSRSESGIEQFEAEYTTHETKAST